MQMARFCRDLTVLWRDYFNDFIYRRGNYFYEPKGADIFRNYLNFGYHSCLLLDDIRFRNYWFF